ncbi:E3 ubiquitin-protein ligase SIAH1B-like [Tigriopus californicus]|nr:E3 ubiquitin-protein ligase SIAH1B-like [Tigriopus californicus]
MLFPGIASHPRKTRATTYVGDENLPKNGSQNFRAGPTRKIKRSKKSTDMLMDGFIEKEVNGEENCAVPLTTQTSMDLHRLTKLVECPVCLGVPKSGLMYVCQNGHNVCSGCWKRIILCPIARCAYDNPQPRQNLTVQALIEVVDFDFACEFASNGCEVTEKRVLIEEHEEECPYRLVPCPDGTCTYLIKEKELEHHLKEKHQNVRWITTEGKYNFLFTLTTNHNLSKESWEALALQCLDQTFFFQMQRHGDLFYMWNIVHGNRELAKKYNCSVQITSNHNELKTLEDVFPVDIPREEIWDDPNCFQINARLMRNLAIESDGHKTIDMKIVYAENMSNPDGKNAN